MSPYIGRPIGVAGHTTQKLDDPSSISGNAFTLKVGGVAISPDASSLAIYVDGVRQEAGDAYTVSPAAAHARNEAIARIEFDPTRIANEDPVKFNSGKFTFEDIVANSRIYYINEDKKIRRRR